MDLPNGRLWLTGALDKMLTLHSSRHGWNLSSFYAGLLGDEKTYVIGSWFMRLMYWIEAYSGPNGPSPDVVLEEMLGEIGVPADEYLEAFRRHFAQRFLTTITKED